MVADDAALLPSPDSPPSPAGDPTSTPSAALCKTCGTDVVTTESGFWHLPGCPLHPFSPGSDYSTARADIPASPAPGDGAPNKYGPLIDVPYPGEEAARWASCEEREHGKSRLVATMRHVATLTTALAQSDRALERAGYTRCVGPAGWRPPVNEARGQLWQRLWAAEDALAESETSRRAAERERDALRWLAEEYAVTERHGESRQFGRTVAYRMPWGRASWFDTAAAAVGDWLRERLSAAAATDASATTSPARPGYDQSADASPGSLPERGTP